jgi:hypothetical protein
MSFSLLRTTKLVKIMPDKDLNPVMYVVLVRALLFI